MYDQSDPRSKLRQEVRRKAASGSSFGASYEKFYESSPIEDLPGLKIWYARGQNFILSFAEVDALEDSAGLLDRIEQGDEYVLLLPDAESLAEIITPTETLTVEGFSLVIIPPGESKILMRRSGRVIRLFTTMADDLLAKCSNSAHYAVGNQQVSALIQWPAPPDGFRVRAYSLDVPQVAGRFGRIFRCTTFMVNYLYATEGPRDPSKLSPHHHDDFEQGSLALAGTFIHHLRWAWTTDKAQWRADEHEVCATPSLAIIPPPVIHTTEATGAGLNQLVDIFCGPREDFSKEPGWVLNADEYPHV